jgi:hypothetical protein
VFSACPILTSHSNSTRYHVTCFPCLRWRHATESDHVTCVFRDLFLGYITRAVSCRVEWERNSSGGSTEWGRIGTGSTEEYRKSACEDLKCDCKILCVIFVVIWVLVSVLRSVARRRLVETENPSAWATVKWKVCKSATVLYCLYLSVIKRECVTEVLINPIIRTRTRHSRHAYYPARDNMHSEQSYKIILLILMSSTERG